MTSAAASWVLRTEGDPDAPTRSDGRPGDALHAVLRWRDRLRINRSVLIMRPPTWTHARPRQRRTDNPLAQALRAEDRTVIHVGTRDTATALIGKWGLGDVGAAECGLPLERDSMHVI